MYAEIKIGDTIVPMRSSAATPFRFKQVFHQDLLKSMTKEGAVAQNIKDENNLTEEETAASLDIVTLLQQLAFIMFKQAEDVNFKNIGEDAFFKWLEEFPTDAFNESLGDIMEVYNGTLGSTSKPKK